MLGFKRFLLLAFLLFLFNIKFTKSLGAEKLTLNDAITKVLAHNGELLGAKAKLLYGEGLISEAKAGFAPKTSVDIFAAPIFKTTGNALHSTSDWSQWGALTGVRATILQPIYTFGMISSYKKAAKYGAKTYEADYKKKKQELIYNTKQFYYGIMLAYDLVDIITEAKDKIKDTINEADGDDGKVARGKMKIEDLYALKTFYSMLMPKYDEALRTKKIAIKALKWVMMEDINIASHDEKKSSLSFGLLSKKADNKVVELEDNTLNPEDQKLKPLKYYTDLMIKNRPDAIRLKNGVLAKKALYNAQKSKKYPMLFALGTFYYTHTGIREDQTSTFANDPYNDLSGAFLIGLRLNLDWWTINAKAKQQEARYLELYNAQDTLNKGMKLELEKTYLECLDFKKAIKYGADAEKNAKKWLMNVFLGYGMGTVDTDKLTDALKAYFGAKLEFNMSIYKYNMSLAQMTKLVGVEVLDRLKY